MAEAGDRVLELRVPARASELRGLRERVRKCVTDAGADPECASDVVMAVDEASQNIIRHAYGESEDGVIEIAIEQRGKELVISLRDYAPEIDPAQVRGRDLDDVRPGGLGTHLIRQVMDRTEFQRPPSGPGNLLLMVKRIR
jgi:sigma-B regulation protein RsbU (phosphoserine phosphatase)